MAVQPAGDVVLSIRPTLFIGIGGTGELIVRRIKKLVRESYGGSIEALRYLVIDAADLADPPDMEPLEPEEKCPLPVFDASSVIQNIDRYPAIKAWWPEDPMNPGQWLTPKKLGISTGAGQDRLMGRLFFHRYYVNSPPTGQSIRDALQRAIAGITRADIITGSGTMPNGVRWEITGGGEIRIVMVFSLCGGTGGGMFLDTAYACRALIGRGRRPFIDAYAVMPSVYERHITRIQPAERENINANSCAALKDIIALNQTADWKWDYAGQTPPAGQPPFDMQFLFEFTQTHGIDPGSSSNLFDDVAQSVFLNVATSMSARIDVARGQIIGRMQQRVGAEKRLFSSLGSVSTVYPCNQIMDYCGAMLAKDFVQQNMSPDTTRYATEKRNQLEKESKNEAAQFLQHQQITSDQIVGVLISGCNYEVPNSESLISEAKSNQGPRSVSAALTQLKEKDQELLISQTQLINKKADELFAEKMEKLKTKTADIVVTRGFPEAREFLKSLLRDLPESPPRLIYSLPDSRDQLSSETKKHQRSIEDAAKGRERTLKNLSGALVHTFLTSMPQRQSLIANALNSFREYYLAEIKNDANNIAIAAYASFADRIKKEILETLEHMEGEVNGAVPLLRDAATSALKKCGLNASNPFTRSCVTDSYVTEYYNGQPKNMPEVGNLFWRERRLAIFTGKREQFNSEAIAAGLLPVCREQFQGVLRTSVVDVVKATRGGSPGQALEKEFNDLRIICYPFLSFDESMAAGNAPQLLTYLGMAGQQELNEMVDAIGADRAHDYNQVATGLPYRIDALAAHHCIVPGTLISWEALEKCYQQAIAEGKNIRMVVEEDTSDIEAKENAFALCIAYGFISREGDNYFWNPGKVTRPPRANRIAGGRAAAMSEFARRHGSWAEEGEAMVSNSIETDGADASIAFFKEWLAGLDGERVKSPTLGEQYMREIKAIEDKIAEIEEKKRTGTGRGGKLSVFQEDRTDGTNWPNF